MKKIIKAFVILLCAFAFNNALAGKVEITGVELVDNTNFFSELSNPTIDNDEINYNLKFQDFEQYAVYKITLSNNTNNDYDYALSINDSFVKNNSYLFYDLIDDDYHINANSSKDIQLKILYDSEIDEHLYLDRKFNLSDKLELVLTGPKDTSIKGVIEDLIENPKTGRFIIFSSILLVVFGIYMGYRKIKFKSFFKYNILIFVLALPMIVFAKNITETIKINLNIELDQPKIAIFEPGVTINKKMRDLAGDEISCHVSQWDNKEYCSYSENNSSITKIKRSTINNENSVEVQDPKSPDIITMWYDSNDKTIYYYSDSERIYYNPDSTYFYQYLSKLDEIDTAKADEIKNADYMFYYTSENVENITLDLSDWNIKNITSMSYMFSNFGANSNTVNLNISDWVFNNLRNPGMILDRIGYKAQTINIEADNLSFMRYYTDMIMLFGTIGYQNTEINISLKNMYINNTLCLQSAFQRLIYGSVQTVNVDFSGLEAPNTLIMDKMFDSSFMGDSNNRIQNLEIDCSGWTLNNAKSFAYMFSNIGYYANDVILKIDDWDAPSMENLAYMFSNFGYYSNNVNLIGINDFNVSNVQNVSNMFSYFAYGNSSDKQGTIDLDISNWNVSNVKYADKMFYEFGEYKDTANLNISGLKFSSLNDGQSILYGIAEYCNTFNFYMDNTDIFGDKNHLYTKARVYGVGQYVKYLNISAKNFDITNYAGESFDYFGYYSDKAVLDFSGWKISKNTKKAEIFEYMCYSAKDVEMNAQNWDLTDSTSLNRLFYYFAGSATKLKIDISGWDTTFITDFSQMFYDTAWSYNSSSSYDDNKDIELVGVEEFNTSNAINMSEMFYYSFLDAKDLSLDLTSWDVSNVQNMYHLFYNLGEYAQHVSLNVSDWDVSGVTNFDNMFCAYGTDAESYELYIDNWNISQNTNTNNMFAFYGKNMIISLKNLSFNVMNPYIYVGNGVNMDLDLSGLKLNSNIPQSNFNSFMSNISGYGWSTRVNYTANLSNWNIVELVNVTTFDELFKDSMSDITGEVHFDFSGWDVSRISSMNNIFSGAAANATVREFKGTENWNI